MRHFGAVRHVEVTPTISASPDYASGDQIGGINEIANVFRAVENGYAGTWLQSLVVIDNDNQLMPLEFYFFNDLPTLVSVDNGAMDIAASELASKCIGRVLVAAADYTTVKASTNAMAQVTPENVFKSKANGSTSLWIVVVIRGAGNYASTSSLKYKFTFEDT